MELIESITFTSRRFLSFFKAKLMIWMILDGSLGMTSPFKITWWYEEESMVWRGSSWFFQSLWPTFGSDDPKVLKFFEISWKRVWYAKGTASHIAICWSSMFLFWEGFVVTLLDLEGENALAWNKRMTLVRVATNHILGIFTHPRTGTTRNVRFLCRVVEGAWILSFVTATRS